MEKIHDLKIVGGWKVSQDKTVHYRGYQINKNEYDGYYFTKGDYDAEFNGDGWSDNATSADSVEHAIELIDQEISETQNTYVFMIGEKYLVAIGAESLEDASEHADVKGKPGVTLLSVNKVYVENYKMPIKP